MIDLNSILNPGFKSDDTAKYSINRFDYYSGSQITVWFGNICLDDVYSIQWSRTQNKRPIYGYSSQQFDSVAKGTVLIQGSFVVNFRNSGYISLIMNEIRNIYNATEDKNNWTAIRDVIGVHLKNGTFGPATAQEIIDIGNSPDFLTLAKAYEDTIWGGGIPGDVMPAGIGGNDKPVLWGANTVGGPADVRQAIDIPEGFNIMITYGNNSANDARTISDYLQSTVKVLNGVHITGNSQVVQVGGQAVMEQYDFIARGSDEQLGSER